MGKQSATGGRRTEMNVRLGVTTIERFAKHFAEGDYTRIADMVTPPTTKATVSKWLNAAKADANTAMPESIAKAAQAYYRKKEKAEKELAA